MNTTSREMIRADHEIIKRLGDWSGAGAFAVRARRASVVVDLRSARLPEQLSVDVRLVGAGLTLLVADATPVDAFAIVWSGKGRVKDPARTEQGGRALGIDVALAAVVVTGQASSSAIRVLRGGSAQLVAMASKEYRNELARTRSDGTYPSVDDPRRVRM